MEFKYLHAYRMLVCQEELIESYWNLNVIENYYKENFSVRINRIIMEFK